jgi:2-dehydro-3-deoxygalactonokinase
MAAPALIGIDWGTSSLRGALLAADGTVLALHSAPRGLLSVPVGGWAAVFDAEFGAWCAAHPALPVLMAGMVGSRQGWAEAPYCPCPAGATELAAALHWLRPGRMAHMAIVPGISCGTAAGDTPDVMRGEETQVIGALSLLGLRDATLVLPGTHSKWVTAAGGRIQHVSTHMTGECYALLRQHSILARTLPADDAAFVPDAFEAGVLQAQQPGGLLHHLFSVRSLALFDRLDGAALASRLSGLVIGEELRAELATGTATAAPLLLVGNASLSQRYQRALQLLNLPVVSVGDQASWHGLAALAGTLTA